MPHWIQLRLSDYSSEIFFQKKKKEYLSLYSLCLKGSPLRNLLSKVDKTDLNLIFWTYLFLYHSYISYNCYNFKHFTRFHAAMFHSGFCLFCVLFWFLFFCFCLVGISSTIDPPTEMLLVLPNSSSMSFSLKLLLASFRNNHSLFDNPYT